MHSNIFTFYLYEVNIIRNDYSEQIISDMSQKEVRSFSEICSSIHLLIYKL